MEKVRVNVHAREAREKAMTWVKRLMKIGRGRSEGVKV